MKMCKYILIIILMTSLDLSAQVNTEILRKEFAGDGLYNSISLDLGLTKGNTEYTSLRVGARSDYLTQNWHYFLITNLSYSEDAVKKKENRGFVHLRAMWEISEPTILEFFYQKEYNEFTKLLDRNLLGSGLRLKLYDQKAESDSAIYLYAYWGSGIMLESEYLNTIPKSRELLGRLTNYLSIGTKINSLVFLKTVTYFQPSITKIHDYRILSENTLNVKLSKSLSFRTSLRLRYDNEPLENVKHSDISLTNGLSFEF